MTGHRTRLPKSYKITKDNKLKKVSTGDVSKRIRERKSKKVKPVRRTV